MGQFEAKLPAVSAMSDCKKGISPNEYACFSVLNRAAPALAALAPIRPHHSMRQQNLRQVAAIGQCNVGKHAAE